MDAAAEIGEIEQMADVLVGAGAAARKVTVLGTYLRNALERVQMLLAESALAGDANLHD